MVVKTSRNRSLCMQKQNHQYVCLFVCLFVLSLSSNSKIFHPYGDVTISGEGLQIMTYARHSWPLRIEISWACHTYCDTRHPFKMVISGTRDTQTYSFTFRSGTVTTCFKALVCRCWDSNTQPLVYRANALNYYVTAAVLLLWESLNGSNTLVMGGVKLFFKNTEIS